MTTDPKIFKAYDIRGIYGKELSDKTAYMLGLAFAKFRFDELKQDKISLAVGQDMRESSPTLAEHLIEGLRDGGADVVDLGLVSTPTFYFAVAHYGYDGGIMVSASHNPADYNGFKLVRQKAMPVGQGSGMERLRAMVTEEELGADKANRGSLTQKSDTVKDHVDFALSRVDEKKIKPFKVVIDPANAMGAQYFEELFQYLPCELVRINWELDGHFPSHEADPYKLENLKQLADKVKEEKADLGIATDGDGDRVFFVDETGEPVEAGITRAVLSKIFLKEKPGAKIAYDIRPGRITRDVILAEGGVPVETRVGHSLIKQKAIDEDVYFAGESSGHFFLNMEQGCFEVPLIVTLKMLEELSLADKTFSDYINDFRKYYHSGEINSRVSDVAGKLKEIEEKYSDGKINLLDGISVDYEDWWFNVRPSNTEPLLRLNLEAKTKDLMEKKRDELLELIRS